MGGRAGRGRRDPAGRRRRRRQGRLARGDRASPTTRRSPTSPTSRRATTAARCGASRAGTSGDFHVHAEHSAYGDATMTEHLRLRVQAGRRRAARASTSSRCPTTSPGSAWGEIGRYQPRYPKQPDHPQRRGDHLPRPHQQPRQRSTSSTTAPDRSTSSRRTARSSRSAARRDPREIFSRGPPLRRLDPDQPPDDLPAGQPRRGRALPRLLLGVLRRADRLLAGGRLRGRHRAGGHRRHPEPVHASRRSRRYERAARARLQDRGGRLERLAQGGRRDRPARRPGRRGAHRGLRRRAIRARASAAACWGATPTRRWRAPAPPTCASTARPVGSWWWQRAIVGDTIHARGASFTARVIGGNGRQLLIVKDGVTDRHRARHERRLRLPLRRQRQRPLAAAGHARLA